MDVEQEMLRYDRMRHISVYISKVHFVKEHIHGTFEMNYILDGTVQIRRGEEIQVINAGELSLFNPHESHGYVAIGDKPVVMLTLQVHQLFMRRYVEMIPKLKFNGSLINTLPPESINELKKLLLKTATAYFGHGDVTKFDIIGYVTLLLGRLVSLLTWELVQNPDDSEKELQKNRTKRLVDYIDENYRQRITLSMLAEREGISTTHLSHFFKKALGVSFQEYLSFQRLEKALVLMHDKTISMVDICMNCGFSDSRYLEAACQKVFGCSVAEYRKKIETQGEIESLQEFSTLYKRCSRKESIELLQAHLEDDDLQLSQ